MSQRLLAIARNPGETVGERKRETEGRVNMMSSSCLKGQVRYGRGVLLFLGSSLGGVGPVRGLRGGGRGGWCEEWARSG